MKGILRTVVMLEVFAVSSVVQANPFPSAYTTAVEYDGHWYALTLDYDAWQGCEDEAVSVGGHLVTVNDDAENAFLSTTFQGSYTQGHDGNTWASLVWIGLAEGDDQYAEGEFSWVSSEPVTYMATPWNPSVPNGLHWYLHTDTHPNPGTWWNGPQHDDPAQLDQLPRGIIEVVPEPATLALLAMGGLAVLRRRRR